MAACHDCVLTKLNTHATTALMLSTCHTYTRPYSAHISSVFFRVFVLFCITKNTENN
jgi:hypothetical protein